MFFIIKINAGKFPVTLPQAYKEHQAKIKHYFKFIFRQYFTLPILISCFKMYETDPI